MPAIQAPHVHSPSSYQPSPMLYLSVHMWNKLIKSGARIFDFVPDERQEDDAMSEGLQTCHNLNITVPHCVQLSAWFGTWDMART